MIKNLQKILDEFNNNKLSKKTDLQLSYYDRKHGFKRKKEDAEKSRVGTIKTKWLQLLEKYPLEIILKAQKNNNNHQTNSCKELGISFLSYKKLCKHYGIELKKSNYEKTEFARTKQSEPILVWQCSKRKPFRPIGKPKVYYSVSECCRVLELHKGNMLRNMQNKTPYRNMFFKKK